MSLYVIILIAIGLSMDSFAVSVSNGLIIKNLNIKKALLIAFSLAFFQALMPLIGWFAGIGVQKYIKEFDHWIAFIFLSFIGIKMIMDGSRKENDSIVSELNILTLLAQSLATSIDALIIGISFALLNLPIIKPVIIIGIITFLASILGLQLGKYVGKKIGQYVGIIGGLVLIGIGVKILIEHLLLT